LSLSFIIIGTAFQNRP